MQITDVRYVLNDGYPEVHFRLDGREASASLEQKLTAVEAGLISLHPKDVWNTLLPPVTVNGTELRGFVRSPELIALLKEASRRPLDQWERA